MKIYKKVIMTFVLCLTMGTILFFTDRNVMTTYAYTDEEKAAAKAWLSENGYPPTMDGAQQAYQDYLNGKFGPVGGNETPEDNEPQTPDETNNETGETTPPVSQEGDSDTEAKTEEKEDSSDSETNAKEKEGDTGSETKADTQKSGSGSETKANKQKSGSGSETKANTQKDASGSRTKKEEKESSSDSKTKAALQKGKTDAEAESGKSDLEIKPAEKNQTGDKSTETESDGLFASGAVKTENHDGSDIGIVAESSKDSDIGIGVENPEDSAVSSEITAGNLRAVKHGGINAILIMAVVGAIALIYFIRHFYIGNKREKCREQ